MDDKERLLKILSEYTSAPSEQAAPTDMAHELDKFKASLMDIADVIASFNARLEEGGVSEDCRSALTATLGATILNKI